MSANERKTARATAKLSAASSGISSAKSSQTYVAQKHLSPLLDKYRSLNASAETINKAEVIHRRGPWQTFEAVEYATLEWVDCLYHLRLLEPIGNIPPAEAKQRHDAMTSKSAIAA